MQQLAQPDAQFFDQQQQLKYTQELPTSQARPHSRTLMMSRSQTGPKPLLTRQQLSGPVSTTNFGDGPKRKKLAATAKGKRLKQSVAKSPTDMSRRKTAPLAAQKKRVTPKQTAHLRSTSSLLNRQIMEVQNQNFIEQAPKYLAHSPKVSSKQPAVYVFHNHFHGNYSNHNHRTKLTQQQQRPASTQQRPQPMLPEQLLYGNQNQRQERDPLFDNITESNFSDVKTRYTTADEIDNINRSMPTTAGGGRLRQRQSLQHLQHEAFELLQNSQHVNNDFKALKKRNKFPSNTLEPEAEERRLTMIEEKPGYQNMLKYQKKQKQLQKEVSRNTPYYVKQSRTQQQVEREFSSTLPMRLPTGQVKNMFKPPRIETVPDISQPRFSITSKGLVKPDESPSIQIETPSESSPDAYQKPRLADYVKKQDTQDQTLPPINSKRSSRLELPLKKDSLLLLPNSPDDDVKVMAGRRGPLRGGLFDLGAPSSEGRGYLQESSYNHDDQSSYRGEISDDYYTLCRLNDSVIKRPVSNRPDQSPPLNEDAEAEIHNYKETPPSAQQPATTFSEAASQPNGTCSLIEEEQDTPSQKEPVEQVKPDQQIVQQSALDLNEQIQNLNEQQLQPQQIPKQEVQQEEVVYPPATKEQSSDPQSKPSELIDFGLSPPDASLPVQTPLSTDVAEKPPPTDFSEAVKQIQDHETKKMKNGEGECMSLPPLDNTREDKSTSQEEKWVGRKQSSHVLMSDHTFANKTKSPHNDCEPEKQSRESPEETVFEKPVLNFNTKFRNNSGLGRARANAKRGQFGKNRIASQENIFRQPISCAHDDSKSNKISAHNLSQHHPADFSDMSRKVDRNVEPELMVPLSHVSNEKTESMVRGKSELGPSEKFLAPVVMSQDEDPTTHRTSIARVHTIVYQSMPFGLDQASSSKKLEIPSEITAFEQIPESNNEISPSHAIFKHKESYSLDNMRRPEPFQGVKDEVDLIQPFEVLKGEMSLQENLSVDDWLIAQMQQDLPKREFTVDQVDYGNKGQKSDFDSMKEKHASKDLVQNNYSMQRSFTSKMNVLGRALMKKYGDWLKGAISQDQTGYRKFNSQESIFTAVINMSDLTIFNDNNLYGEIPFTGSTYSEVADEDTIQLFQQLNDPELIEENRTHIHTANMLVNEQEATPKKSSDLPKEEIKEEKPGEKKIEKTPEEEEEENRRSELKKCNALKRLKQLKQESEARKALEIKLGRQSQARSYGFVMDMINEIYEEKPKDHVIPVAAPMVVENKHAIPLPQISFTEELRPVEVIEEEEESDEDDVTGLRIVKDIHGFMHIAYTLLKYEDIKILEDNQHFTFEKSKRRKHFFEMLRQLKSNSIDVDEMVEQDFQAPRPRSNTVLPMIVDADAIKRSRTNNILNCLSPDFNPRLEFSDQSSPELSLFLKKKGPVPNSDKTEGEHSSDESDLIGGGVGAMHMFNITKIQLAWCKVSRVTERQIATVVMNKQMLSLFIRHPDKQKQSFDFLLSRQKQKLEAFVKNRSHRDQKLESEREDSLLGDLSPRRLRGPSTTRLKRTYVSRTALKETLTEQGEVEQTVALIQEDIEQNLKVVTKEEGLPQEQGGLFGKMGKSMAQTMECKKPLDRLYKEMIVTFQKIEDDARGQGQLKTNRKQKERSQMILVFENKEDNQFLQADLFHLEPGKITHTVDDSVKHTINKEFFEEINARLMEKTFRSYACWIRFQVRLNQERLNNIKPILEQQESEMLSTPAQLQEVVLITLQSHQLPHTQSPSMVIKEILFSSTEKMLKYSLLSKAKISYPEMVIRNLKRIFTIQACKSKENFIQLRNKNDNTNDILKVEDFAEEPPVPADNKNVKKKSRVEGTEHFKISNLVWFLNFHARDEPSPWVHAKYMRQLQSSSNEQPEPVRYSRYNDASHKKWIRSHLISKMSSIKALEAQDPRLLMLNSPDFQFLLNDEFGYQLFMTNGQDFTDMYLVYKPVPVEALERPMTFGQILKSLHRLAQEKALQTGSDAAPQAIKLSTSTANSNPQQLLKNLVPQRHKTEILEKVDEKVEGSPKMVRFALDEENDDEENQSGHASREKKTFTPKRRNAAQFPQSFSSLLKKMNEVVEDGGSTTKQDKFTDFMSDQFQDDKITEFMAEAEAGSDRMSNFDDTDSDDEELPMTASPFEIKFKAKIKKLLKQKGNIDTTGPIKRKPLKLKRHRAGLLKEGGNDKDDKDGTTLLFKTSQAQMDKEYQLMRHIEANKQLATAEILPEVQKKYFKNLEDFNAQPISRKVVANPKLLTIITRQKKVPAQSRNVLGNAPDTTTAGGFTTAVLSGSMPLLPLRRRNTDAGKRATSVNGDGQALGLEKQSSLVQMRVMKGQVSQETHMKKDQQKRLQQQQERVLKKDQKEIAKVFQSIERGQMNSVNDFIRRNILRVDVKDVYGNTLLSVAAQYGCFDICDLLVKNNANVNTQNSKGNTPLHYAHAFGHRKIIDLMMENEASEEVINEKKLMPWEGI